MRFLLVCSGTAGHINPALAIAGEIRHIIPDAKIQFVGSGRALEGKLIPQAGYELKNITMTGLKRGISPGKLAYNMKTAKNLMLAGKEAAKIINTFKPDAVVGTGGYVCYPVLKSAARMDIPTLVHESNAVPGLTTKLLSAVADKVLVSFPGIEGLYRRPERIIFTGTPIRGGFGMLSKESARRKLGIDERPLIVSFWGSLGAERMNEAMAEFIKLNMDRSLFNHIHATGGGEKGLQEMLARLEGLGIAGKPPQNGLYMSFRSYIEDMPDVMAAADLILCRAGASTLAELTNLSKPAVLVPSPYVTNNHQEANARQLEKAGGAAVLLEKECTGKRLYDTVAELVQNPKKLQEMSSAQKSLAAPGAAEKIAEIVISMCK